MRFLDLYENEGDREPALSIPIKTGRLRIVGGTVLDGDLQLCWFIKAGCYCGLWEANGHRNRTFARMELKFTY